MTNFPERDTQRYDYSRSIPADSAPMWIIGSVVILLVAGIVWYAVSGSASVGPTPDQSAIQHMTQPPARTAPPAEPSTTPKP